VIDFDTIAHRVKLSGGAELDYELTVNAARTPAAITREILDRLGLRKTLE
jgi:hypothetical protein